MDRNQNVILDLNGRTVGLRFDNWAFKETQLKTGSTGVINLLNRIGVDDSNIDLNALIIFGVEAYHSYQYNQKLTGVITDREMSIIIDECGGPLDFLIKISEGLRTYVPKNSYPPQMVGEISQ